MDWAKKLKECQRVTNHSDCKPTAGHYNIQLGLELDPGPKDSHFPHQVHGNQISSAGEQKTGPLTQTRNKADGIYTKTPQTKISIRTADCLPLLLWGGCKQNPLVMGLHAGWKGLTAGIIKEGVEVFTQNQIPPEQIYVCLNPCISKDNYEVGEEVLTAFKKDSLGLNPQQLNIAISSNSNQRWQADLQAAAIFTLLNQQLLPENIIRVEQCTFNRQNNLPSYRRDGRVIKHIWSWIMID